LPGKRTDIVTSINRAAETVVLMARDLLVSAVRTERQRRQNLATGGETPSPVSFFLLRPASAGREVLPVVTKATEKVGLATAANEFAAKASGFDW
jgi:hypothetical protein